MRSSYKHELDFGECIKAITLAKNPTHILEIGILDGFSLDCFNINANVNIQAYDIFEEFI